MTDEYDILTDPRFKYTRYADLLRRRNALWAKIEEADAAGDEYHADLWMRLMDRLEEMIARQADRDAGGL